MNIQQLYQQELKFWEFKNRELFGVTPIVADAPFDNLKSQLEEDCKNYWNNESPCVLANLLNDGTLDSQSHLAIPNTYELVINLETMGIDILRDYVHKEVIKKYKVASIPTPCKDLTWIINNAHYTPRITAIRDINTLIAKREGKILGERWTYDFETKLFKCFWKDCDPDCQDKELIFNEHLSNRSKALLQAFYEEEITVDNFIDAFEYIPTFDNNSIFNYKFTRFDYFDEIVNSSRRYAKPIRNKPLMLNMAFLARTAVYTSNRERLEGQVVLSQSPIFSLENFRTVVNIWQGGEKDKGRNWAPPFTFTDTLGFFDAFKTATTCNAGRQRLLLDNVFVRQGMLWIKEQDGTEKNMYEYYNNAQEARLSCLSYAMFANNNKPKRLMMNAKMTSQAVPLKDENCPITHRIPCRVAFVDIDGLTFADAIVISESFAKKLTTFDKDIIIFFGNRKEDIYTENLYLYFKKKYDNNEILTSDDFALLYPRRSKAIIDSYQNGRVSLIEELSDRHFRVHFEWEIPFGLGDKLSNLHGAKGVVGRILPDQDMPKLMKKVGNMESGPLEVIISGFSTIRRGSLGQIFEAWATASGIEFKPGEDLINLAIQKYGKQMRDYSKNSRIKYKGKETIGPVGIIDIMRLNHHASKHISESRTTTAYNKMLKFGEMEKLNLLSTQSHNILEELSIRSMQKHLGSKYLISEMERERVLPEEPVLSLRFAQVLKSIGFEISLDGKPLIPSDLSVIGDFEDTYFEDEGEEVEDEDYNQED